MLMQKVRVNDLARELGVKSTSILAALPLVGVSEPKTHSSTLELDEAEKVRAHFNAKVDAAQLQRLQQASSRPASGQSSRAHSATYEELQAQLERLQQASSRPASGQSSRAHSATFEELQAQLERLKLASSRPASGQSSPLNPPTVPSSLRSAAPAAPTSPGVGRPSEIVKTVQVVTPPPCPAPPMVAPPPTPVSSLRPAPSKPDVFPPAQAPEPKIPIAVAERAAKPAETVRPLHDNFPFMQNDKLREIANRELSELNKVREVGANKCRLILVGAIIEALLLDALQPLEDKAKRSNAANAVLRVRGRPMELSRWGLLDLIKAAVELKVVSKSVEKSTHQVRLGRNLIHPGVAMDEDPVRAGEANIAEEVLKMVEEDLRERRRKLSGATDER